MKKYFISVGEPWDYEGPDGKNLINGRILKVIDNRIIVFKSDHKVNLHNVCSDVLVLLPRYDRDFFSIRHNRHVTVGGALYKGTYDDNTSEEDLKNSEYVLIGGLNSVEGYLL